jgi:hypothetical protein
MNTGLLEGKVFNRYNTAPLPSSLGTTVTPFLYSAEHATKLVYPSFVLKADIL